MDKKAKIYISGHTGLLGSAFVRYFKNKGHQNIIIKTRKELDLTNQKAVANFFAKTKPDYVFHCAARVGSLAANIKYPAEFIYENLMIETNVIHQAYLDKVKNLIFFGANCAYPRLCPQPMKEEHFLTGSLEPTNQAYAVAKIAGIELCKSYNQQYGANFLVFIPASLYGPGDYFGEIKERSHVIPDLIKKMHQAKINQESSVTIVNPDNWREFLYVDDLARACLFVLFLPVKKRQDIFKDFSFLNVGWGQGVTIRKLAQTIQKTVGYKGKLVWSQLGLKGMPKKILSTKRIETLGWQPKIKLEQGLKLTYQWFLVKSS